MPADTRPNVQTAKQLNLAQLAAEIGPDVGLAADDSGRVVVVSGDATQQQLAAAVAAHAADPEYGHPAEDRQLTAVRAKAQAVLAGPDTFTAAQVQKLLAALVLRATR